MVNKPKYEDSTEIERLRNIISRCKDRTIEALRDDIQKIEEKYYNDKWYGGEQYNKDMKQIDELSELIDLLEEIEPTSEGK